MAIWLSQAIFCLEPEDGLPCGKCQNCTRILEHQHPDVTELAPDGLSIKVDQVRELKPNFLKVVLKAVKKFLLLKMLKK